MLSQYLEGNIQFVDSVSSWEESIEGAAQPLLAKGNITSQYIQDMIENVNENGPYIIIVPGIAMPHARNEGGVLKTGMSFLKVKNPVVYPDNKEVNIFFVLAAEDGDSHLDIMSSLSSILIDEVHMEKLKNAETEAEILDLIKLAEDE